MAYIEEDGMLKAKNYRFFERSAHIAAGRNACFPTYYHELLKCAFEKVWIWDPYFISNDEDIFGYIPSNVDVRLLYLWNKNPHANIVSPITGLSCLS